MIVLKIGGSAFSDKRTGKSFVNIVARNVAKELPVSEEAIKVHGAGYMGHSIASKYKLLRLSGNQLQWSLLRYEIERITNQIAKVFIDNGKSPLVMSAQQLFRVEGGKVHMNGLDTIKAFSSKGFIPIIHGDVPFDDIKGLSVLSGDDMAVMLANRLDAKKLIFGMDTDGLLDASGKVIKRMSKGELSKISITHKKGVVDVTGGMKGKLEQIALAKRSVPVLLINIRRSGELRKAIEGKSVGTTIF